MTLYSISSRCTKVEAAFMDKYPGNDLPFPSTSPPTSCWRRSPVSTMPASM
ncbi:MAG: hypothetical protein ACLSHO_02070 [Dysosmobacter sp.]